MAQERKLGAGKRFGNRYGKKMRDKFAESIELRRDSKKCPFCRYERVKRIFAGVWECSKCNAKFTGRAYSSMPSFTKEKTLLANSEEQVTE